MLVRARLRFAFFIHLLLTQLTRSYWRKLTQEAEPPTRPCCTRLSARLVRCGRVNSNTHGVDAVRRSALHEVTVAGFTRHTACIRLPCSAKFRRLKACGVELCSMRRSFLPTATCRISMTGGCECLHEGRSCKSLGLAIVTWYRTGAGEGAFVLCYDLCVPA